MDKKEYLSFTHGTMLQTLCGQLLQQESGNRNSFLKWIRDEKCRLRRTQPTLWAVPVSTRCYYEYLGKIENLIQKNLVEKWLPQMLEEITRKTRTKIHALFLTQEMSCWPSLESVFAAARNNEDFEAALVYTPFYHENFSEQIDYYEDYRELGLPVLRHNQYDLPAESPDVVFTIKPYANIPELYQQKNLEQVVPRVIYIAYGMELTTDLIKFGFQYYAHYKAWRHVAYGDIVKEFGKKYGYRGGDNIVVWGHPKADHYRDMESKMDIIPREWTEKIRGRRTILWTPHHLIDLNSTGTGTWLIWGEHILNMAMEQKDVFFIIRPHPLMVGALVNSGCYSQSQMDRLMEKIDQADNIIWDNSPSYLPAFYAADAIITDGTTFSFEFLYTKKPILLTPRNMESFYQYEDMMESYYLVNRIQDISDFVAMIRDGQDPLREKRLAMYEKTFYIPEDCTVGENIMRQVKKDLQMECSNMAIKTLEKKTVAKAEMPREQVECEYPLFSILVLCYKNQPLLYGMLDSIFRQDYPRIQLVISDDGSEDFDIEKVQEYIELHKRSNIENVIVRSNEQNMRTVKHVDMALKLCTGEYLVFTAADDRFCGVDTISRYVEKFLEKPDRYWLVARCSVTSADYTKHLHYLPAETDEPYFAEEDAPCLYSRWARRGMAIPCCMAWRKDAFELVGGIDLDYQFMEDWPLELKLLLNGHAPIYLDEVTALHSAGGITNSNARYGKEIRRQFYEDKYTIFRKEVTPNIHLLLPEDRKAYKQYLKEIMARHYFFYIDLPGATAAQKIKLCLKKPIRAWWMFENFFVKVKDTIPQKKLLVAGQALMLASMLFLKNSGTSFVDYLFRTVGWVDLVAGLLLTLVMLLMYPLDKHFSKKARLRHHLVN